MASASSASPIRPRAGPGQVLGIVAGDALMVWLLGGVDRAFELELSYVSSAVPAEVRRVIVDAAELDFCDSAVTDFIGTLLQARPVTIRFPSYLLVELLSAAGIAHLVDLQRSLAPTRQARP